MKRIHIMGASGSGATTLGAALAARLGVPHFDADTYFWIATDPPYVTPRAPEERVRLLLPLLTEAPAWVLSGAAPTWGQAFTPLYDGVVFLRLDPVERMRRLRAREVARHGDRVLPGGDMHAGSVEFLAWAEGYDRGGMETRSLRQQEAWLAEREVPVLRVDSALPVSELVAAVLGWV